MPWAQLVCIISSVLAQPILPSRSSLTQGKHCKLYRLYFIECYSLPETTCQHCDLHLRVGVSFLFCATEQW